MKLIEGVVEVLSFKEIPEDRFGNTVRQSIKIGEEWIGMGTGKKAEINVKQGAGWVSLEKGDKIALVVDETEGSNGTVYLNGQKKTIKVLSKGNGSASGTGKSDAGARGSQTSSAKPSQSSSTGTASGGTDWARKDAGAAASASIDKALRYIELRQGEVKTDYGTVLSIARDFQQMVRTLADEILAGPAKPAPAPEPEKPVVAKPKAASSRKQPEPEPEFEDDPDLPFN